MPDVTGMGISEVRKALKELGLEIETIGEGEEVTDQLPKKGIKINTGTKVTIYTENQEKCNFNKWGQTPFVEIQTKGVCPHLLKLQFVKINN